MLKNLLLPLILLISATLSAQVDLKYFLPAGTRYNASVPRPSEIIHHEVGEWHVTHDRLVNYMHAAAKAAPSRVKLETMGFTYERRPQVLLIITSPRNHARLEEIRTQHLKLSDPSQSNGVNVNDMPVVVWIGHSIHGNEPSGANASLLSAYHLAAAEGNEIEDLLENTVILLDPSFNPDGLQRFSTWANQHKSKNLVSDPNSREFNEVWPGGRFNHYWFDLNRDWLPAVHVESQNRLEWFHKWKPNILTDHHEQGSNATFFFQPGVPSRVNPLTPVKNQELTAKLGNYHSAFLDSIGSLYFTKESYDDFYYGKGSTYPDINGAIGILFEQASSRGHLQETNNGLLSFPFTIRNQFVTTLSTLKGARELKKEFLEWQREFYQNVIKESAADLVKGYVFGATDDDEGAVSELVTMLERHQINVHKFSNNLNISGKKYETASAFVVPMDQPQAKLIRTIFSKPSQYIDSLFYDITAWTVPLAFGIEADELNASQMKQANPGVAINGKKEEVNQIILKRSEYAYLIDWNDMMAPAALYKLLSNGVIAKTATSAIEININGKTERFAAGTILVPVAMQKMNLPELHQMLETVRREYKIKVHEVSSGLAVKGIDLGSGSFLNISRPSIAMLTGSGVNALDAGEVWHLLDQRMGIPSTHLETSSFNRVDLSRYNTIVMVSGSYNDLNKEKLKEWVERGGTLIAMEDAVTWAVRSEISKATLKKAENTENFMQLPYSQREQMEGAQQMRGAIFEVAIDKTHPLAYGYPRDKISLFKSNKIFIEKSKNPYSTPFYYENKPLQAGWASRTNLEMIKGTAAVVVNTLGSGRVINIAENPNFRAMWLGGTKLFMNSIFFGRLVR